MSLKTGYKHVMSDVLGIIFIAFAIALTFVDIYHSTNPDYGFHLEWYYIGGLILLGLICVFFEPEDLKKLFGKLAGKAADKL